MLFASTCNQEHPNELFCVCNSTLTYTYSYSLQETAVVELVELWTTEIWVKQSIHLWSKFCKKNPAISLA